MFAEVAAADVHRRAEQALAAAHRGEAPERLVRALADVCAAGAACGGAEAHMARWRVARQLVAAWRGGTLPAGHLAHACDALVLWTDVAAVAVAAAAATRAEGGAGGAGGEDGADSEEDEAADLLVDVMRAAGGRNAALAAALRAWAPVARTAGQAARERLAGAFAASMHAAAAKGRTALAESVCAVCAHISARAYDALSAGALPERELGDAVALLEQALGEWTASTEDEAAAAAPCELQLAASGLLDLWLAAPDTLPGLQAVEGALASLAAAAGADDASLGEEIPEIDDDLHLGGHGGTCRGNDESPDALTLASVVERLTSPFGGMAPEEGALLLVSRPAWLLDIGAEKALEEHVMPLATPDVMLCLAASLASLARDIEVGAVPAERAAMRRLVRLARRLASSQVGATRVDSEWFAAANCVMNHADFAPLHAFAEADPVLSAEAHKALVAWSNAADLTVMGGRKLSDDSAWGPTTEVPGAATLAALGAFMPSGALRRVLSEGVAGPAPRTRRAAAMLHAARGLCRRRAALAPHLGGGGGTSNEVVDGHSAQAALNFWPEVVPALREVLARPAGADSSHLVSMVELLLNGGALGLVTAEELLAGVVAPCCLDAGADGESAATAAAFEMARIACEAIDGSGGQYKQALKTQPSDAHPTAGVQQAAASAARGAAAVAGGAAEDATACDRAREALPALLRVALAGVDSARRGEAVAAIAEGMPFETLLTVSLAVPQPAVGLPCEAVQAAASSAHESVAALVAIAAESHAGLAAALGAIVALEDASPLSGDLAADGHFIDIGGAAHALAAGASTGRAEDEAGEAVLVLAAARALAATRISGDRPACHRAMRVLERLCAGGPDRVNALLCSALALAVEHPADVYCGGGGGAAVGRLAAALVEAQRALGQPLAPEARASAAAAIAQGFVAPALKVLSAGGAIDS